MAGVSCMGAESLGRLWGRGEPSMKEGAKFSGSQRGLNMPRCGACLLANVEIRRRFLGVAVLVTLVWDVA